MGLWIATGRGAGNDSAPTESLRLPRPLFAVPAASQVPGR
jgi:hypothetical protein